MIPGVGVAFGKTTTPVIMGTGEGQAAPEGVMQVTTVLVGAGPRVDCGPPPDAVWNDRLTQQNWNPCHPVGCVTGVEVGRGRVGTGLAVGTRIAVLTGLAVGTGRTVGTAVAVGVAVADGNGVAVGV